MKTSSREIVVLNLINKHYNAVNIYWLSGGGEQLYSTLNTGESYQQGSYKGDEWLVKDKESDEPLMNLKAVESTEVQVAGENRRTNLKAHVSRDIDIIYKRPVIEKQYALDFDGDNDVVIIPADNNFNLDNKWTLEAWIYRRRSGRRDPILDKSGDPGGTNKNWGGFTLQIGANNKLQASILTKNRSLIYGESDVELLPRRWYHVAASFDGERLNDEIQCFINGQPVETTIKQALDIMDNRPVLSFDGKNDYLEIPDHSALRFSTYTIEVWIKPEKLVCEGGYEYTINSAVICKEDQKFGIYLYKDYYGRTFVRNGMRSLRGTKGSVGLNGENLDAAADLIKWDDWNHIAITYDSKNEARTYVNGVLEAKEIVKRPRTSAKRPLYIGCSIHGDMYLHNDNFKGEMAEVRIWNKARSEAQIQAWMHRSVPGNSTDLAAYWRFDDGLGATAIKDYSQNKFNIQLHEPVSSFDCSGRRDDNFFYTRLSQIYVLHDTRLNLDKSFTLEAWIYLAGGEGKSGDYFITKQDAWCLDIIKDKETSHKACLRFRYRHRDGTDDDAWCSIYNKDVPLNGRGWTHVAVGCQRSANRQTMYMYIDEHSHQTDMPHAFHPNKSAICIGNDSPTGTVMRISNVYVWGRVITQHESRANRYIQEHTGDDSSLIARWLMDKYNHDYDPSIGMDYQLLRDTGPHGFHGQGTIDKNTFNIWGTARIYFREFTIECWLRPPELLGGKKSDVIKKQDSGGKTNFCLFLDSSTRQIGVYYTFSYSDKIICKSKEPLAPGEWVHVAAVYESHPPNSNLQGVLKIYLNGELNSKMDVTQFRHAPNNTNSELFIDPSYLRSSSNIKGNLCDVRIWKCARTQDEIKNNMRMLIGSQSRSFYSDKLKLYAVAYDANEERSFFSKVGGLTLQTKTVPRPNKQGSLSLFPDILKTKHVMDAPLKIGACEPENERRLLGIGQNSFFNGCLDAVRIWNQARTAADISNHWNTKLTGNETGLQGYWRFDEGSGERVFDGTTHNNHGEFGGMNQLSDVRIWKVARGLYDIRRNERKAIPLSEDPDRLLLSWLAGDDNEVPSFRGTEEIDLALNSDDAFTIELRVNVQSIRMSGDSHYILCKKGSWVLELVESETGKLYFRFSYNYQNRPANLPWHSISSENSSVFDINSLSWVHVAVVGDRGTHEFSLYVNGIRVHSIDPDEQYPYEFKVSREPIFIGGEGKPKWRKSDMLLMDGLQFDGKNDYIQVPEIEADFSRGFTVEAWVYYERLTSWARIIDFSLGKNDSNIIFSSMDDARDLRLLIVGSDQIVMDNVLEAGKWIHLAATIDQTGDAKIYKYGKQIGSGKVPLPPSAKYNSNFIGRSRSGSSYFHGKMDEVRVWNTVRSADQINAYIRRMVPTYHSRLVGLWRFKEGSAILAFDDSNRRHHGLLGNGTLSNTPKWLIPQPPERTGLTFDGVDDYVQIPEIETDFSNGISVEAWVYYKNFNSWSRIIDFGLGQYNQNIAFYNVRETNRLCFWIVMGSQSNSIYADVLEKNKWLHVAATVDKDGNAKLYKNGLEVANGTLILPTNVKRTSNYIGRSNWSTSSYFQGQMDEMRLWNTARSAKQILANMHGELNSKAPGLVGYWRMNEDRGKYVSDITANQNHGLLGAGKLEAMPTWTEYPNIRFDGFLFDGKGNHVEIFNSKSLDQVTDFSITAWIKPNDFNGLQGILTKVTDIHACQYGLSMEGDTLRFDYEKDGNNYSLAGGELKEGWNHVAVTVKTQIQTVHEVETNPDGTLVKRTVIVEGEHTSECNLEERLVNQPKIKLYINGLLAHSGRAPIETEKSAAAVHIGGWGGAVQNHVFHGYIDSAIIWSEALSQKSIQQKMQQRVNSSIASIVGNWRLSEDSPYRIKDLSGKNNHGALGYYGKLGGASYQIERGALQFDTRINLSVLSGRGSYPKCLRQFTLEYWVMHTSPPKPSFDYERIACLRLSSDQSDQFETAKSADGQLAIRSIALKFSHWVHVNYYFEQDKWTHLAFALDGKNLNVYVDGKFVFGRSRTDGVIGNGQVILGGTYGSYRSCATMNLAEVRLYDIARSRKSILEYKDRLLRGTEEDLICYWPLSESGVDLCGDRSLSMRFDSRTQRWLNKSGLKLMLPKDKGQVSLEFNTTFYSSNYISVDFKEPETDVTREFWIRFKTGIYADRDGGLFSATADSNGLLPLKGYGVNLVIDWHGDVGAHYGGDTHLYTKGLKLHDGHWHHVAHVSDSQSGVQRIYVDGIEQATGPLMKAPRSGQERILIGAGSYGGGLLFPGQIAEVRIWNKARTADEIANTMNSFLIGKNEPNLVGYWRLDRGYGRQIENLADCPGASSQTATIVGKRPHWRTQSALELDHGIFVQDDDANALEFKSIEDWVQIDNFDGFPSTEITAEFWLKTDGFNDYSAAISYAQGKFANAFTLFYTVQGGFDMYIADIKLLERKLFVHDNKWHHYAVTWRSQDGRLVLYMDGKQIYSGSVAVGKSIPNKGCLILGQDQDLVGGGFESRQSLIGQLAEVRIWNKVRSPEQIENFRFHSLLGSEDGLAAYFPFSESRGTKTENKATGLDASLKGKPARHSKTGIKLKPTVACLSFDGVNDRVQIDKFTRFPSTEITLEFWLKTDGSNDYNATVSYYARSNSANAFTLFYSVHGGFDIHIKDVRLLIEKLFVHDDKWHHFAVTWRNQDGRLVFYMDGRPRFCDNLAAGQSIPDDGCLIFGQSQNSIGGGFSQNKALKGELADVRIWNTIRSSEEIKTYRTYRFRGSENNLIGYWPMSGTNTKFTRDLTTNQQHGHIHSAKRASLAEAPLKFHEATLVKLPPSLCTGKEFNDIRLSRLPGAFARKMQMPTQNLPRLEGPDQINRRRAFGDEHAVAAGKLRGFGKPDPASLEAEIDKFSNLSNDEKEKLHSILGGLSLGTEKKDLTLDSNIFQKIFDSNPVTEYISSKTLTISNFDCKLIFDDDEEEEEEEEVNTDMVSMMPVPDYSEQIPIGIYLEGVVTLPVLGDKKARISLKMSRNVPVDEEDTGGATSSGSSGSTDETQSDPNWVYTLEIAPQEGFGLGNVPVLKEIPIVRDINFHKPSWDAVDGTKLAILRAKKYSSGSLDFQEQAIEDMEEKLELSEDSDKTDVQRELDDLNEEFLEMEEEFKSLNSKKLVGIIITNEAQEETKVVPGVNVFGSMKFDDSHSNELDFIETVFGVSELQFYGMVRTAAKSAAKKSGTQPKATSGAKAGSKSGGNREYLIEMQSSVDLSKSMHPKFKLVNLIFGIDSMDLSISVSNIQPPKEAKPKPSKLIKNNTVGKSKATNTPKSANVYTIEAGATVDLESAYHPMLKLLNITFGVKEADLKISGTRHGDNWELEAEASTSADLSKSDHPILNKVRDIFGLRMFKLLIKIGEGAKQAQTAVTVEAEATINLKKSTNSVAVFLKNLFGVEDLSMELSVIFEQEKANTSTFTVQAITVLKLKESTNIFFKELHEFFGLETLTITFEITENAFELHISMDVEKKLCDAVKLVNLAVAIAVQTTPPEKSIELTTGFEVMAGEDKLKLTGRLGVEQTETAVTFTGSATMQGSWRNPFGIKGLIVSDLALQAGVDPKKPPSYVTELGLAGKLAINKTKAQLALYVNANRPNESAIIARAENIDMHDIVNTFTGYSNTLPHYLVRVLEEIVIKSFELCIVPGPRLEPLKIGDLTFEEEGITASCDLSLWGWKTFAYFNIDYDDGITACGAIDAVNIAGVFKLSRPDTSSLSQEVPIPQNLLSKIQKKDGPYLYLHLTPDMPEVALAAKIELLGISCSMLLVFTDGELEFSLTGRILNLFQATLTVRAPSDLTSIYIKAELQNDLFAEIRRIALRAIEDISDEATAEIDAARRQVERMYGRIEDMRRRVKAERDAVLSKIRSAQRTINKSEKKIDSIRDEIDEIEEEYDDLPAVSLTEESKATAWVETGAKLAVLNIALGVAKGVLKLAELALEAAYELVDHLPINMDPRIIALYVVYEASKKVLEGVKLAIGAVADLASMATRMALGEFFDVRYAMFELDYSGKVREFQRGFEVKLRAQVVFLGSQHNLNFVLDLESLDSGVCGMIEKLVDEVL